MIFTLMMYCFAMAALIGVAAFALEKAVALVGRPRRAVWIAGLVASICLPAFMILASEPSPTPAPEQEALLRTAVEFTMPVGAIPMATNDSAFFAKLNSIPTGVFVSVWGVSSVGVVLFVLFGWVRLRAARRSWTADTVEGVHVRVAENLGPAVVGFFRPEIVVPRWLLAAPQTERRAAIAHERSHIVAGDTFLLFVATLLVVAMPWNLTMWWQLRRLRFAIEVDCDRRVLRDGISVETYGEMLLAVGKRHSRLMVGAMAMSEPVSQLERRVRIMTRETLRLAKPLIVVALAMSTSIVAVATQLKAPSLGSFSPSSTTASVIDKATPQQEFQSTKTSALSEIERPSAPPPTATNTAATNPAGAAVRTIDNQKASATPVGNSAGVSSKSRTVAANRPANTPIRRLAQAPSTYIVPTPTPFLTAERVEVKDGLTVFHNVIAKMSVGEKFQVFEAVRGELHGTTEAQQTLVLYDGKHYEEGPGARDIDARFAQLTLLVPKQMAAKTTAASVGAKTSPSTQTGTETAERLNLNFENIDVRSVIKVIADASGQNILVSDKVSGKISVRQSNVLWTEALDYVCKSAGLSMRKQGNVIFIEPDAAIAQNQTNATTSAASGDRGVKRTRYVQPAAPSGTQGSGRWVEVGFTVDPSGSVKAAEITNRSDASGDLDEPVLTAVRQWLYEPAIKDGLAVDTRTLIRIRF